MFVIRWEIKPPLQDSAVDKVARNVISLAAIVVSIERVTASKPTTPYLERATIRAWTAGPDTVTGAKFYGTAIMYRPGKIRFAGGSDTSTGGEETITPTNTAEVIDLYDADPKWRQVDSMAFARQECSPAMEGGTLQDSGFGLLPRLCTFEGGDCDPPRLLAE